jgi:hypothetical protein
MASRAEVRIVYLAGIAQGIALVTFPAVSTVLTDPDEYDLSNTQYGSLTGPRQDPRRRRLCRRDERRPHGDL